MRYTRPGARWRRTASLGAAFTLHTIGWSLENTVATLGAAAARAEAHREASADEIAVRIHLHTVVPPQRRRWNRQERANLVRTFILSLPPGRPGARSPCRRLISISASLSCAFANPPPPLRRGIDQETEAGGEVPPSIW
jgi:hypothetical protein